MRKPSTACANPVQRAQLLDVRAESSNIHLLLLGGAIWLQYSCFANNHTDIGS